MAAVALAAIAILLIIRLSTLEYTAYSSTGTIYVCTRNGVHADVVVAEHANAPGAQNTGAAVVVVVGGGGVVVVVVVVAVAVAVNVTGVGAQGTAAASLPPLSRSLRVHTHPNNIRPPSSLVDVLASIHDNTLIN